MSSLMSKLLKTSTVKATAAINNSSVYGNKEIIQTPVPMVNVALSGDLDGGLLPGLTLVCGPSKHFKSGYTLLLAASFLKKYDDGVVLFYDSEFGTPIPYFEMFGIDLDRVIHTPITNIEELQFDIVQQLEAIEKKDRVMIIIDSIGNLASKREVDNALNQNSAQDMTRAKSLKGLFRIITPHLNLKDIPMVAVNHVYKEQGLYPKDIVSGGTGIYLSADNIWIIGRQQDKEGTEVVGYNFIINIEKSRHVREKSKIPIKITREGGINKWSGLFEVAQEGQFIISEKKGYYKLVDLESGEVIDKSYRAKELEANAEVLGTLVKHPKFKEYIRKRYTVGNGKMNLDDDDMEDEINRTIGDDVEDYD